MAATIGLTCFAEQGDRVHYRRHRQWHGCEEPPALTAVGGSTWLICATLIVSLRVAPSGQISQAATAQGLCPRLRQRTSHRMSGGTVVAGSSCVALVVVLGW
jgi:hypothetical protein